MSEQHEPAPPSMGSPDESLGGRDIDEAVANAEAGSQVDGVHTPSGKAESGESRLEQMVEVDTDRAGEHLDTDPPA